MSLNAIATPAAREPGPLVARWRSPTVAKVDSIGFGGAQVGGGPDGIIIDEHDNLWIACNQSDEVMVLEPKRGGVIAKLGDFGGIDEDGAPIGFLWSNSLVFHGDDVLVTNLSADIGAMASKSLRTVDGPWAAEVKLHTVSKIKKRLPGVPE